MRRRLQIISIILASTNYAEMALGFSSTVCTVRPSHPHSVDQHGRHRHHRHHHHGRRTRREQQQQQRLHAVNDQEQRNEDNTGSDTKDVTLRSRWEEAIQKLPNAFCSVMLAVAVASTQLGSETAAVAAAPTLTRPETTTTTTTTTASSTTATAARIHLNNFPPTTVSIQIGDLPVVGPLVSGTYAKTGDESLILKKTLKQNGSKKEMGTDGKTAPLVIRSPEDKVGAIFMAGRGHFEFEVEGLVKTHLDVDVASEPGAAVIRVFSPIIPRLPFRNSASDLVPPAAGTLKKFRDTPKRQAASNAVVAAAPPTTTTDGSPTAAHLYLNSLPPAAVSVEIEDLFVLGKLLSGVYTKIDDVAGTSGSSSGTSSNNIANAAAIVIESPRDKVSAIKNIASNGQLSFDVDGLVTTHLDVNIATDTPGSATILVTSPLIPALPFQNAASF